jgi:hypothetical protein
MIAWIHIPKTAGTAMEQVFREVYGADKCFFTDKWEDGERMLQKPEEFLQYEVVGGHLPWSSFSQLPITNFVSIFRKPIARYVSHFRHMGRTKEHPLHEKAASMSLKKFSEFDNRPNEQCWYWNCETAKAAKNLLMYGHPRPYLFGIMEDLPALRRLLTLHLDRDFPEFPKANVAQGEMEIEPRLADDIMYRIFEDVQLYHWVSNQVKNQGSGINSIPVEVKFSGGVMVEGNVPVTEVEQKLPEHRCTKCGSFDIHIAASVGMGSHYCHACRSYFDLGLK